MNKDLIEKLKDNESHRIFGDMTNEEQKCLVHVGNENLLYLRSIGSYGNENFLLVWEPKGKDSLMYPDVIYAIKPDYQPESEYVDLEIKKYKDKSMVLGSHTEWIGIFDKDCPFELPHYFTHLHCLLSLPNFEGFYYDNVKEGRCRIAISWVASELTDGKKVYARFRK